jgi:hypothetical protein
MSAFKITRLKSYWAARSWKLIYYDILSIFGLLIMLLGGMGKDSLLLGIPRTVVIWCGGMGLSLISIELAKIEKVKESKSQVEQPPKEK